jgi:rhodanese-related sulfurtransferase
MYQLIQNRKHLAVFMLAGLALIALLLGGNHQHPKYNVPEVNLAEAKTLIDAGALVLDVRGEDQFNYRHLPTAVLMPLMVLQAAIPASLASAKDRQIVVYCNEGVNHGPEAAYILQQAGYTKVVNMKSGIEGWAAAGLPVKNS